MIHDGWIFPEILNFRSDPRDVDLAGGLQQCEHLDEQTGSRPPCGAQTMEEMERKNKEDADVRPMNHQHMEIDELRTWYLAMRNVGGISYGVVLQIFVISCDFPAN